MRNRTFCGRLAGSRRTRSPGPWGTLLTDNITMKSGETRGALYGVEVWEDVPPKDNFLLIYRVSELENLNEMPMPVSIIASFKINICKFPSRVER